MSDEQAPPEDRPIPIAIQFTLLYCDLAAHVLKGMCDQLTVLGSPVASQAGGMFKGMAQAIMQNRREILRHARGGIELASAADLPKTPPGTSH